MSWAPCSLYSGGAKVLQVSCLTCKTWCNSGNLLEVCFKALCSSTSVGNWACICTMSSRVVTDVLTEGDRNWFTKALLQPPLS